MKTKFLTESTQLNSLKKLGYLISSKERRFAIILLILSLIKALIETIGVASIMPFIAVLSEPSLIETNSILNKMYQISTYFGVSTKQSFLFALGLLVFLFLMFSLALNAFTQYLGIRFIEKCHHSISRSLVEGYLNQPYSWFLNRNSALLGTNILSEASQVVSMGMKPMIEVVSRGVVIIFMFVLLLLVDVKLALSIFVVFGGAYLLIFKYTKKILRRIGQERYIANQQKFATINEAFGSPKDVKVKSLEKVYLDQFSNSSLTHAKRSTTAGILADLPRYILEAVSFGGMLLVMLYLIGQKGNFSSALPIISVYAFAGYRMMPSFQRVYHSISMMRFCGPVIDTIYDTFKNLSPIEKKHSSTKIKFEGSISLKNIYFEYPNTSKSILKNINIKILNHNIIGIVGRTGSGKTTIIDIILGLLEPQKGLLEVDGEEINRKNVRSWQKNLGYVPQHIYLSDDTIAKNIAFGVDQKDINQETIEKVSKIANLHNFVTTELPEKYDTTVGERGIRLSGGQRQRIGIARALYHNPKVLILDEATSALDNETEKAVMDAIDNIGKNMTIIIIAHRMNTIKKCDMIFLLDKGEIKKQGKFEDIITNEHNFIK
ncbi:MAG: ABC transporter ATP-binding protein [Pelagibacteraceae bacterium TMED65]|nr:MAG: ABC transporter ATP-binding protein [Pelagibacteraceae bacterium TMED65]|tara:strand:+ start:600 stop:2411 length:1812 start_codon:yes stop_codon:yes gene_type:complete